MGADFWDDGGLMNDTAKAYLRAREWTMGNGQCHDCCGLKPGAWFGRLHPHPSAPTKEHEGHYRKCKLAAALESLGEDVVYRSADE